MELIDLLFVIEDVQDIVIRYDNCNYYGICIHILRNHTELLHKFVKNVYSDDDYGGLIEIVVGDDDE